MTTSKSNNMFKSALIAVLMLSVTAAIAQPVEGHSFPIDSNTELISYAGVVDLPGKSKDDLYKAAEAWVKEFYSNPGSFWVSRDAEKGKIEGKYRFNLMKDVGGNRIRSNSLIKYTLTLWFKDGKYRYRLSKINLKQTSYFPIERWLEEDQYSQEATRDYLNQVDEYAKALVESLEEGMKSTKATYDEDDW